MAPETHQAAAKKFAMLSSTTRALMPTPLPTAFSKTLRALDRTRPMAALWWLLLALAVLGGLAYWAAFVPVTLYEISPDARLEINTAAALVQAPMTGAVVESNLALGRRVEAGDVLVRMDSLPEQLQAREQETKLRGLDPEIASLQAQIAAEETAGADERKATNAAVEEARLKVRELETPARLAVSERRRFERLKQDGLAADRDVERAIAEADRLERGIATATAALERLDREQKTRDQQRLVRIAEIRTAIARLEGGKANTAASIRRVNYETERRVIRAPISGTLGEALMLRPGAVLAEGARLASIVPAGQLRIVSHFAPRAAYGRVRPGARARLRLEGYPWTEFGVVEARVSQVAGEDRDGRARVELDVIQPPAKVSLRHGMPGELEIEVDRTPPLHLLLRTAGQWLTSRP